MQCAVLNTTEFFPGHGGQVDGGLLAWLVFATTGTTGGTSENEDG
jgi:hypothetical protein